MPAAHGALHWPRRRAWTPKLSITLDDLPARRPYVLTQHPRGLLIIARSEGTHGALFHAYMRSLPGRVRALVCDTLRVADPVLTPEQYRPWWDPDAPLTLAEIRYYETTGDLVPWPHGH